MDENGLRNWGYYEPSSFKAHLGLELMSTMQDQKPFLPGREQAIMPGQNGSMPDRKPFISGSEQASIMVRQNGSIPDRKPFLTGREHVMLGQNGIIYPRDMAIPESPMLMNYGRDSWVHRDHNKFINMLPGNSSFGSFAESSALTHQMQMLPTPPPLDTNDMRMALEDPTIVKEGDSINKRMGGISPKAPKPKKAKKEPSLPKDNRNTQRGKPAKKNIDIVINGIDMDIAAIPIPVCSCTGTPQQCYRWGCGGWQSACCTTTISMYPLPMSTKRRGARIAGRKMSLGAFKKVLERLSAEGFNFSNAIDLRSFWAKHGTNKFVTIR